MTIDVRLLGIRAGGSLRRHKSISHPVGIDIRFVFVESLELFDKGIQRVRIVFRNIKLNAGMVIHFIVLLEI